MLRQHLLLDFLLLLSGLGGIYASLGTVCLDFRTCQFPYVVVFDAGSTGTTAFVYQFNRTSWRDSTLVDPLSENRSRKLKPGISAFSSSLDRIEEHLSPLLEFARRQVPVESQPQTLVLLAATAGVRALPKDKQLALMSAVSSVLRRSPFPLVRTFDSSVVLSGQEEAYYALLVPNILLDNRNMVTMYALFGIVEIGGGSAQVAVSPSNRPLKIVSWDKVADGTVYVSSTMGLGKSAATLHIMGYRNGESLKPEYKSPCLSPQFTGQFSFNSPSIFVTGDPSVQGQSRWSECRARVREFIETAGPIAQAPPLPRVYIGMGSIYFVSKSLLKFGYLKSGFPLVTLKMLEGGSPLVVSLKMLEEAAKLSCISPPARGKYEPYLCLDSVYIVTLLKEAYKFPDTQPIQIVNTISGITPSWSFGLATVRAKNVDSIGSVGV